MKLKIVTKEDLKDWTKELFQEKSFNMIDVSNKEITLRRALATGSIIVGSEVFNLIKSDKMPKGDPITLAEVAAVLGVKRTSDLIPLCHPLSIEGINIDFQINNKSNSIKVLVDCKTTNKTGIEIEVLTAVSICTLTIYDMCKSVDRGMKIDNISLTHKSGGKSGTFNKK